ncbi:MAG: hypothetical protein AVDCRST_MAG56-7617, partial [uncultured Cytophagales bacterium]
GKVQQRGPGIRGRGHARNEGRQAQVKQRAAGNQPQAGHCHRAQRSPRTRRQSARTEKGRQGFV